MYYHGQNNKTFYLYEKKIYITKNFLYTEFQRIKQKPVFLNQNACCFAETTYGNHNVQGRCYC